MGKQLFEFMLQREQTAPHQLGYDRPSPKLIGFLRKHYNLTNYDPQANNFVVFSSYFTSSPARPRVSGQQQQEQQQYPPQQYPSKQQQQQYSPPRQQQQYPPPQQHQQQGGGFGRPSHRWWHDSGAGLSQQQPSSFYTAGSEGRNVPASAPAGLQGSVGDACGMLNPMPVGGAGHAGRASKTAAQGATRGVGGDDDSLSSFARFATGGGAGPGAVAMAGVRVNRGRGVLKSVQEQVGGEGGVGGDLQELASARVGGRKFVGGGWGDMYQRSSAAYGQAPQQQQQQNAPFKQQQLLLHFQQDDKGYPPALSDGGWKYNPYEQLGLAGGQQGGGYQPLVQAARSDRRATRLW